jgi:PucR C-terminal helix-turn-helix domain
MGADGGELAGITRTPDAQALVREIVLRIDVGELAQRMVEEFHRSIESYRRMSPSVVTTQIQEVVRDNLALFIACALDVRAPLESELAPFRESARDRATEGIPLADLLAAYRLGGRMSWQALAEQVEPSQQPSLVIIGDLVMRYVDEVSTVVAETYLDERQHLVSEKQHRLRELVEAMTAGEPLGAAHQELADAIGFPLVDAYRPFVLHVAGGPARDHSVMASRLQAAGVLALTEGDRVVGLLPEDGDEHALRRTASVLAVGELVARAELRAALDDLRLLVDLAIADGADAQYIDPADHLPELLVGRSPALARQLRRRVIEPLRAPTARPSADLVATLSAFLAADLDRRAAAARLHIHPNTLDHRLRRIRDLTGLRFGCPRDLALVVLALSTGERDGGGAQTTAL